MTKSGTVRERFSPGDPPLDLTGSTVDVAYDGVRIYRPGQEAPTVVMSHKAFETIKAVVAPPPPSPKAALLRKELNRRILALHPPDVAGQYLLKTVLGTYIVPLEVTDEELDDLPRASRHDRRVAMSIGRKKV